MAATLRPKRRALSIGRRSSSISGDSQERERAHLGFAPVSFIDNIINATNDYCCDGIDAIEEELSQALPSVDAAAITHACDQLQALLQGPIDKNFDKFELFALGNSFKVPDNLPPPPTYPQHEMTLEESELDEELEELRKQVLEVRWWLVGSLPISIQSTSLIFTRSIIRSFVPSSVGWCTHGPQKQYKIQLLQLQEEHIALARQHAASNLHILTLEQRTRMLAASCATSSLLEVTLRGFSSTKRLGSSGNRGRHLGLHRCLCSSVHNAPDHHCFVVYVIRCHLTLTLSHSLTLIDEWTSSRIDRTFQDRARIHGGRSCTGS